MSIAPIHQAGRRRRTDIGQALGDDHPSWIVCRGKTRDVIQGMVHCPQNGTASVDVCLGCHLLATLARERNLRLGCTTAE
jgi:hypothetical protein